MVLSMTEFLRPAPQQHKEILYDKISTISTLITKTQSESSEHSLLIENTNREIFTVKSILKSTREEKVQALNKAKNEQALVKETEKYRKLENERQILECALVKFKLQVANNKSELEGTQDDLYLVKRVVKRNDEECGRLLKEIEAMKQEKFNLMMNEMSSTRSSTKLEGFAFMKRDIKPCPSSGYKLNWGFDSDRSANQSMNCSFFDEKHAVSKRSADSSRYS